ncbi:ThiF family adenylyltransferase [Facilibium subflavum]|uniref:ThiF family adenylyltransferase n=1 Tax=Facilibium subflavum TaxID=2219058 RepID=UPI000E6569A2|nr:ThiF family adenylyltransferase [Facilibium subflavum]
MNFQRYQRHYPVIGLEGQQKLSYFSICLVGCGGIGSPAALYLAAAGIGRIGLVDFDQVALSNLQRQIVFTEADIGKHKTEIAKEKLSALNSSIEIEAFCERLSYKRALEILSSYDLVIDGSDNYQTRFLLNDACCKLKKPLISASVLQTKAQLAFFDCQHFCYRCLYAAPPPDGMTPSCAEAGVIGATAGVIGTMAANMAINYALQKKIHKQLMIFDSETLSWQYFDFTQQPDCPGCVKQQYIPVTRISIDKVPEVSDFDSASLIIDVREDWELQLAVLDREYIHIPLNKLLHNQFDQAVLSQHDKIVLLCKSGTRSQKAAKYLKDEGIENVFSFKGGLKAYLAGKNKRLCY